MIDGMTSAPSNLLTARKLLLTHLDNSSGPDDLEPGEVGIVGDSAHRGGYHCGEDRVVSDDYSVHESPRDEAGLSIYASALDVGRFTVTTPKGTFDLPHYSRWIVAQCMNNTPDTRHFREVIYSPDGKTVRRWDRLGRRSSGDSSHLYHTHESYFRDATKSGADLSAVKRRYLVHIGVLESPVTLTPEEHAAIMDADDTLDVLDGRNAVGQVYTRIALGQDHLLASQGKPYAPQHPSLIDLGKKIDAVLEAVNSGNSADATRDSALRADLAKVARGEWDAEAFVEAVRRKLAGPIPPTAGQ